MRKLLTILVALGALASVYSSAPVEAQLSGGLMFPGPGTPASSAFTPASLSPAWWAEARNFANFFISNAGSGAAPAANGDLIGWIPDQSTNGVTLASAANDATRLTLAGVGTFPSFTCTAASSTIVHSTVGLNSYNAGASSWFFAVKSNSNAISTAVAEEGSSTVSASLYSLSFSNSGAATTLSGQIRNSASTSLLAATQALQTGAFNGSNHVIGIIDNGTTVTPYLDGVAGTPFTYTARTGTLTTDRFAICGLWRTAGASFWNGSIYGGVVVNRVLMSSEITNLSTYLATLF